jgi:excisionase family DNA binding protein
MSKNTAVLGELLTKEELAERLRAPSIRLVEELMRSGKIPFLRLGHRTVRFDWPKVQAALARLQVDAIKG